MVRLIVADQCSGLGVFMHVCMSIKYILYSCKVRKYIHFLPPVSRVCAELGIGIVLELFIYTSNNKYIRVRMKSKVFV